MQRKNTDRGGFEIRTKKIRKESNFFCLLWVIIKYFLRTNTSMNLKRKGKMEGGKGGGGARLPAPPPMVTGCDNDDVGGFDCFGEQKEGRAPADSNRSNKVLLSLSLSLTLSRHSLLSLPLTICLSPFAVIHLPSSPYIHYLLSHRSSVSL